MKPTPTKPEPSTWRQELGSFHLLGGMLSGPRHATVFDFPIFCVSVSSDQASFPSITASIFIFSLALVSAFNFQWMIGVMMKLFDCPEQKSKRHPSFGFEFSVLVLIYACLSFSPSIYLILLSSIIGSEFPTMASTFSSHLSGITVYCYHFLVSWVSFPYMATVLGSEE